MAIEATVGETILNGKYRLLAVPDKDLPTPELGRGNMGVTYLAEELDPHGSPFRTVALKMMLRDHDGRFDKRFLTEVHAAAQLHNEHTTRLYGVGEEQGQLYYSMEYVRGRTLKDLLDAQGPLQPAQVVKIVRQICEALAEAHNLEKPIVHRDLKPANILIQEWQGGKRLKEGEERIKVADFGIAKILDAERTRLTFTGNHSPGTPIYMAPEQCEGQEPCPQTDLYALGIMMYEMLVGCPPFMGATPAVLMYQHVHEPPPELPATVPEGIRRLVKQLLTKAPESRPRDALFVRQVLEDVFNDRPTRRTSRRYWVAGGLLGLGLFAGALGLSTWRWSATIGEWELKIDKKAGSPVLPDQKTESNVALPDKAFSVREPPGTTESQPPPEPAVEQKDTPPVSADDPNDKTDTKQISSSENLDAEKQSTDSEFSSSPLSDPESRSPSTSVIYWYPDESGQLAPHSQPPESSSKRGKK